MLVPARRLDGVRKSLIHEMTRLALSYHAINLAQGFPDFDPPREIIEAAHHALDSGTNQYTNTWGIPALRQAIAAKMKHRYNLEFCPDKHITVTCGATEAISAALMATVNPGDEVIIFEPFHEGYLPAACFAGATPRFVALDPPNYPLDLDRLRASFGSRTRAILVNTPHNPTGRVLTHSELSGIARLCQEFDSIAISDEIYEHIIYADLPHIPLASLPGMRERTITVGGFSKTFAVTGWRIGYVCALDPLSTALRTFHDYATICAPSPLQTACVAALELPPAYYEQMKLEYRERRDKMMSILREARFEAQPPEGAYYVMADFGPWKFDGDDVAFARYLAMEYAVAVVPASSFYGTPGSGKRFVRFAFAKKAETLSAAGECLRNSVAL